MSHIYIYFFPMHLPLSHAQEVRPRAKLVGKDHAKVARLRSRPQLVPAAAETAQSEKRKVGEVSNDTSEPQNRAMKCHEASKANDFEVVHASAQEEKRTGTC